MRNIAIAATLMLLSSSALAQTPTGGTTPPPPAATSSSPNVPISGAAPEVGSPQNPGATVGRSKVADDGISIKTEKAVPCSKAARETDGFTTCIGIPEPGARRSTR